MPNKISLEEEVQDRFFNVLINQDKGFEKSAINVYQKLVYTRFENVIKDSMPLFLKYVSSKTLEKYIKEFMKETPETPFVWQVPNEFRKFVKKQKYFHKEKYIYELMYYDTIEVELYMTEYKFKKRSKFAYSNNYELSLSARIKRFSHDIIGNNYSDKRENWCVIYYDFSTDDVVYREINPLIYTILKSLNKKLSLNDILKTICKENEIDFKEAKKLLKEPLKELYLNRVFI